MKITFYDDAVFEAFHEWASIDKRIFDKLVKLIKDMDDKWEHWKLDVVLMFLVYTVNVLSDSYENEEYTL